MKKTLSNPKSTHRTHQTPHDHKSSFPSKNKTTSTVTHVEADPQQHTTKKSSLSKVISCTKIGNSIKSSKIDLITIEQKNSKFPTNSKSTYAPNE
jgi:hypothetical protein